MIVLLPFLIQGIFLVRAEQQPPKKDTNLLKLTAWYVTGITDGEGSFQMTIQDFKGQGLKGFKPFLEFKLTEKKYSIDLLLKLKNFFFTPLWKNKRR